MCCVASHRLTARAHILRRRHHVAAERLREEPSECVPGFGERVERRPDVIRGRKSFVSIHTRPTEAQEPSPEVYRGVREARNTLPVLWWG